MREATEIVVAQATTTTPTVGTLAGATASGSAAASGPDWWILMSLIYLACGLVALAATIIGGCQWHDCGPARRAWAAKHQVHGISFSALLLLIGLFLQGFAQFVPALTTFGPTMVAFLMGLMVLGLAYVLTSDYFDAEFEDDAPRAREVRSGARRAARALCAHPSAAATCCGTGRGTPFAAGDRQRAATGAHGCGPRDRRLGD